MDIDEKTTIDQAFKHIERVFNETPSKQRKHAHQAWLTGRREHRRRIIRQYIDSKPKPTALSDDELWELAGIVGCSTAKVRQLLRGVLLHVQT